MFPLQDRFASRTISVWVLLLLSSLIFWGCLPKESRLLHRSAKSWNKGPMVLHAYLDTPLSGEFLTLWTNHYFERESSGMFRYYGAGRWSFEHDTFRLQFWDLDSNTIKQHNFTIDTAYQRVVFEGDTVPYYFQMRVLFNALSE